MRIEKVEYEPLAKIYHLANGRKFTSHRYCCLGIGDEVVLKSKNDVKAVCRNGQAQILPIYKAFDELRIGGKRLKVTVKEIETEEELNGYHHLEKCHYRGKVLHGRRAPLIVRSEDPLLPLVLGYIELSTAFMMNKPRANLLNEKFESAMGDIKWEGWKKDAVQQYTNLIVRIARTVVSPEFRGLGLARVLVKHGARFARQHWNVGGLKGEFLEITADMLRYIPFVEAAGMHYVGDTEGNLSRVNKDMDYILKNYSRVKNKEILKENAGGIVDLQVYYATHLREIQKKHRVPRARLLDLLLKSPHKLSDDHWTLMHRIFRLPKPTFMMGLTPETRKFIGKRIKKLGLPSRYPAQRPGLKPPALKGPIKVSGCTLELSAQLVRTRTTRKIQQAFGVSRDMLNTTLFSDLNFSIAPGNVVLICGPSGAGKTTLLSLLTKKLTRPNYEAKGLVGTVSIPGRPHVAVLGELPSIRPLINSLNQPSFEEALFALNVSGLAEAHLYVKRFKELSNGQRYRAMVAKLITSNADVWVADEFCATLDPITANIVARNLRRCAKELGVTVILAAANWTEFIDELRPDTVIHLKSPWDTRIFSWDAFRKSLSRSQVVSLA